MSRRDKLPEDPGLPRLEDQPREGLRHLTTRLTVLLRQIVHGVNLLIDGFALDVTATPTASSVHRGRIVYIPGAAGVTDTVYMCLKSAADTYSWRVIETGG